MSWLTYPRGRARNDPEWQLVIIIWAITNTCAVTVSRAAMYGQADVDWLVNLLFPLRQIPAAWIEAIFTEPVVWNIWEAVFTSLWYLSIIIIVLYPLRLFRRRLSFIWSIVYCLAFTGVALYF